MVGDGQILKVVATFDLAGVSKAQNVFHLQHNSGSSQEDSDVLDACLNWIEEMWSEVTATSNEDVSLESVDVYEHSIGGWLPVGSLAGTWAGTSIHERVPSGIAVLIHGLKERTNHTDKKYLAGTTEATLGGDAFTGTMVTAAEALAAVWVAEWNDANGVDLIPVSYSRTSGIPTPYSGYRVSSVPSYQRRRKPGRGLT